MRSLEVQQQNKKLLKNLLDIANRQNNFSPKLKFKKSKSTMPSVHFKQKSLQQVMQEKRLAQDNERIYQHISGTQSYLKSHLNLEKHRITLNRLLVKNNAFQRKREAEGQAQAMV